MPRASFPNLTVLTHPLIAHKLSILRDRDTSTRDFKQLVGEIATLMAYEVTKDLPTEPVEIETPLERMMGQQVSGKKLTLVPILRAGLGMVEGIAQLIPSATRRPHRPLSRPRYAEAGGLLLQDPRVGGGARLLRARPDARDRRLRGGRGAPPCARPAPGGSSSSASSPRPKGWPLMLEAHPDVPIFAAALDRQLNEHGYILPGLGDAGDRLFGTR